MHLPPVEDVVQSPPVTPFRERLKVTVDTPCKLAHFADFREPKFKILRSPFTTHTTCVTHRRKKHKKFRTRFIFDVGFHHLCST
jgi:hypothetical protein